ncbi:hypothetical protein [Roseivivax sp. THAF30]|uniref:hypothetical protein n=1 Tax=Roseivivax sp. THAF30 TaxID=2587852 RepID=UPI001268194A|nr:hypothetical protein [Roseivivax sp. THAF30]QFT61834.1 hypothetical protein FIU91_02740 [Roseivivax sp. THAF30]
MSNRFIAMILAASTAIAVSAQEARAKPEDVAKVVGGIALLYIVGEALAAETRKDSNDETTVVAHDKPAKAGHRQANGRGRVELPQRCRTVVDTHRGKHRQVYIARCLERNYVDVARLPEACALPVNTNRGRRLAYGARCLERYGFDALGRR